jgi:hypothetical protein
MCPCRNSPKYLRSIGIKPQSREMNQAKGEVRGDGGGGGRDAHTLQLTKFSLPKPCLRLLVNSPTYKLSRMLALMG